MTGAAAYVDKDLLGGETLIADSELVRSHKACLGLVDRDVRLRTQTALSAFLRRLLDRIFASFHPLHIDGDGIGVDAELGRTPRHVGHACTCHQSFRRNTAGVYAGAAEQMPLNDGDFAACLCEPHGKKWA